MLHYDFINYTNCEHRILWKRLIWTLPLDQSSDVFMHKQMYLIAKVNISASSIVCLILHMENNC